MKALVTLVLNGVVYCTKGMHVDVVSNKGKYTILRGVDGVEFRVSNEVMPLYFC